MEGTIDLIARSVCDECDAFLGKAHKDGCSKGDRAVIEADTTEKLTTVNRAEAEEPMLGIDADTALLIARYLERGTQHRARFTGDEHDKINKLAKGLREFGEGRHT